MAVFINDKLKTYLTAQHIPGDFASADLPTLIAFHINTTLAAGGDYTARWITMLAAAAAS